MNFNFELILFYATLVTGVICLIDWLFFDKKRKQRHMGRDEIKLPLLTDYARSFFPVLLLVFLLRAFLFEPFRIPSGSLEPTLLMGDFILVNKYEYGIRLPVLHKIIRQGAEPQRGDIIVFRWPPNPSIDFIKRVIGLPGDKISYINKELYINGNKIPQDLLREVSVNDDGGDLIKVLENQEDLLGVKHHIYIDPSRRSQDYKDIIVPEGQYFVMGDNRDDSADSRFWGFVSNGDIVGKAVLVWMSWDSINTGVRWKRLGQPIH
jgi:signal peptidase I